MAFPRHLGFAQFGPEPCRFDQLSCCNVVRMGILPVRCKNPTRTKNTEITGNKLTCLQGRFQFAIDQPSIASPRDLQRFGCFERFLLSKCFTAVRCRFTTGEVQDANAPTFVNHFGNCAAQSQFCIIRVGSHHEKVEWLLNVELAWRLMMNGGSHWRFRIQFRALSKLSTASTGIGIPRRVPSRTIVSPTTP